MAALAEGGARAPLFLLKGFLPSKNFLILYIGEGENQYQ